MINIFSQTLNERLYYKLWENKDLWRRLIYIIIPWILLAALYIILHMRGALLIDNAYGFLNDFTNLCSLSYIFIFMYYVGGYYSIYSNNKIEAYINRINNDKEKNKCNQKVKKVNSCVPYLHVFAILLSLCGMWFIYVANLNGAKNWYAKMIPYYLPYYCLLIAISWYMSANVFLRTLTVTINFYYILDYDLNISVTDNDECCGLRQFFSLMYRNIGMALCFVIFIGLIIWSDFRAVNYGVDNAFHKYPILCLPIILILVAYLGIALLPFIKAKARVNSLVDKKLEELEFPDERIKYFKKIKNSAYFSRELIISILANILIPVIGVVLNKIF